MVRPKVIVERRHGEPIKFLFLPKMGLLGSQVGNEFFFFFYILGSAVKGCLIRTKMKKFKKNLESIFGGLKIVFF